MAGAALPTQHPIYAPVSSAAWMSHAGMMLDPRMFTTVAGMPVHTQETGSMMMQGVPTAVSAGAGMNSDMVNGALHPHMMGMISPAYSPMNNVLLNMDVSPSNFNKAINFSKDNVHHDLNHNGLSESDNELEQHHIGLCYCLLFQHV